MRGRIIETNCVLENTPPPLFGLDVVYKIGGRINGTLRYKLISTYWLFHKGSSCACHAYIIALSNTQDSIWVSVDVNIRKLSCDLHVYSTWALVSLTDICGTQGEGKEHLVTIDRFLWHRGI